jgi:hypothetical protein
MVEILRLKQQTLLPNKWLQRMYTLKITKMPKRTPEYKLLGIKHPGSPKDIQQPIEFKI